MPTISFSCQMRGGILPQDICIGTLRMPAQPTRKRGILNASARLAAVTLLLAATTPHALATHAPLPTAAAAGDPLPETYPTAHFGGFTTLAAARSSSDQAEFVRDLSQPDGIGRRWSAKIDSVLGLQGNVHLTSQIEAVMQAVSRYGPRGDFRPELTWAFASLTPSPALALRAGRIGTDFYMLSDSRWVGYASLTVRPPNDYYGALPFYSIDGADVAFTRPLAGGILRAKAFSGLSREEAPLADRIWDLDGSRMTGASLGFQTDAWQWRVSHARIRFSHGLPVPEALVSGLNALAPDAARQLAVADTTSRFTSVGLVHDAGPLQAHLMINRTRHQSAAFQDSRGGYAIVGYRIGRVTPFAGYSRIRSTPKTVITGLPLNTGNPAFDNAVRALDTGLAAVLADSHANQHTTTLGVRFDVFSGIALKAQWDAVRGQPTSIFPYRREQPGWNGRTTVMTFALDSVF